MKKTLLILAFLLFATFVFSQSKITYSKNYLGETIAKDEYGNIIAIGSINYAGEFVWKDQYGNIIKTESKNFNGDTVSKDIYGNTQIYCFN